MSNERGSGCVLEILELKQNGTKGVLQIEGLFQELRLGNGRQCESNLSFTHGCISTYFISFVHAKGGWFPMARYTPTFYDFQKHVTVIFLILVSYLYLIYGVSFLENTVLLQ